MRIFGLDFTSTPSRKKPITCCDCMLRQNLLHVEDCLFFHSFEDFEAFLRLDGPWVAALDFPFGQPRKLVSDLSWPETWEGYLQMISSMSKQEFEETVRKYCESKLPGHKYHLRATDALVGARSPMMLHRIPVGKMFFQGAPRLYASPVSILPCRPTQDSRIVVEGYPALVARKFIGKRSYKSDEREKQTLDKRNARESILNGLRSIELLDLYGIAVELSDVLTNFFLEDVTGDSLDALLCAIQAAWAYSQTGGSFGIPPDCDTAEGWIVDPVGFL